MITLPFVSVTVMDLQLENLVSEASKLSSKDRAALAQVLLTSLGECGADDDAWEIEVERRVADVESGLTPLISLSDALAQVRANLK
jgi:putative addiction module component (TIGR02574 family)